MFEPSTPSNNGDIYRLLQEHLDQQPVGFPATRQGADIRLLQRLFTTEEARIALHLSYKPMPVAAVIERTGAEFTAEQVETLLESLLMKGSIGLKAKDGIDHWHLLPLLLGIYEGQDGQPTAEFLADTDAYMRSLEYRKAFCAVRPSQMRTIPINKSIDVEHNIATYDQIRAIVENAQGPFVVIKCICREGMAMRDNPCVQTKLQETCLVLNDMAMMTLHRNHGREVTREEMLKIIQQNQDDGLVLQTTNAQEPEFVCSCCGCCCGWLKLHKSMLRPTEFWTSSFYAEVTPEDCTHCGECVSRCQVKALTLPSDGPATVNLGRCIGCGLCVPDCPTGAIRLKMKPSETIPPKTQEELSDRIQENRKTRASRKAG